MTTNKNRNGLNYSKKRITPQWIQIRAAPISWNSGSRGEPNKFIDTGEHIIMIIETRYKTKQKYVILDKEIHEKIKAYRWTTAGKPNHGDYAWSNEFGYLHRHILNLKSGDKRMADHINHNRFDCRLANLRIVDKFTNARNRTLHKRNKTGVNGVHFDKDANRYKATINVGKRYLNLGRYKTIPEAAAARKQAELQYWGEHRMEVD